MSSRIGQDPAFIDTPPDIDLLADVRPALDEVTHVVDERFSSLNEKGYGGPAYQLYIEALLRSLGLVRPRRSRASKLKLPPELERLNDQFIPATARLIMERSEPGEELPVAEEVLGSYLAQPPSSDFKPAQMTQASILDIVRTARQLQALSEVVVPGVRASAATPEKQAELMRLLAYTPPGPKDRKAPPEAHAVRAFQMLYTFAALEAGRTTLEPLIDTGLQDGRFDGPIAAEVFGEHAKPVAESDLSERTHRDVQALVRLTASIMGEEVELSEAVEKLATTESRLLLPPSYQRLIEARKEHYGARLRNNFSERQKFLIDNWCFPPHTTEDEVRHLADVFVEEMVKVRAHSPTLSSTQRVFANVTLDRIKRRRQQAPSAAPAAEAAPAEPEQAEAEAREPRKLFYVRPDGSEAPEGSDDFDRFFEEYQEKHRDQVGLDKDLERIKEFLRNLDMSAGRPRGVKPLKGAGDRKLYQLKPVEAVGLPTTSTHGVKLRVFFEMKDERIGFLGIVEKPQAAAFMRGLGVRGRPRSRGERRRRG